MTTKKTTRQLIDQLRDRAYSSKIPDALSEAAAAELERLQLTGPERAALRVAMNAYAENNDDEECAAIEATLYRLLERTKTL